MKCSAALRYSTRGASATPSGVALPTTAVALAVTLFVRPGGEHPLEPIPHGGVIASLGRAQPESELGDAELGEPGVAAHQAQVDYGRVIAGRGFLSTPGDGPPVLTDTFTVGTRFATEPGQSLQVGLLGRILANFEAGTDIEWTQAGPAALDLTLERGLIAVRYERQPEDPVLNIHTPSALVRVVGTVFTVEVDAEGRTMVSVLRGEVEVLNPEDQALIGEVQAGYRFDMERSTYTDVGRTEVRVAMPLSNEGPGHGDVVRSADGTIPGSWVVPGLPAAPSLRRLENILIPAPLPEPRDR